jgi:stearoyl-CoA desaturase (delta-9 desaturase)
MNRIPWKLVNWKNSLFLIGTFLITLTVVPTYLWRVGLDWFQATLFVTFFMATGLSITLGYHRLFSHRTFQASWPVRLFTLLFGAAAFENSVLHWAADHRRHHKFVDQEDDPYDITKGFFHAHIGWILFKLKPDSRLDNVADLQEDRLVRWQLRYYYLVAILTGFVLPTAIGWVWGGWPAALGGFLVAGVARVVFVQHMTFFINSLCHTIGRQPYSGRCTARDSGLMALVTFGEGYHNFHHEFQHDYRNGVKPWQFDPTKWTIWLLHQFRLVRDLRRVPSEKIALREIAETQRQLELRLKAEAFCLPEPTHAMLRAAQERLRHAVENWERRKNDYVLATEKRIAASREKIAELRHEFDLAAAHLRAAIQQWKEAHGMVQMQFA